MPRLKKNWSASSADEGLGPELGVGAPGTVQISLESEGHAVIVLFSGAEELKYALTYDKTTAESSAGGPCDQPEFPSEPW